MMSLIINKDNIDTMYGTWDMPSKRIWKEDMKRKEEKENKGKEEKDRKEKEKEEEKRERGHTVTTEKAWQEQH